MTEDVENSVRVLIRMVAVKINMQGDGNTLLNVALAEAKALLDGEEPGSDCRSREEALHSIRQHLHAYLSL